MRLRESGSSILLISEDLDEILTLSDRIGVMFEGSMVGVIDGAIADREQLGLMMATGSFEKKINKPNSPLVKDGL